MDIILFPKTMKHSAKWLILRTAVASLITAVLAISATVIVIATAAMAISKVATTGTGCETYSGSAADAYYQRLIINAPAFANPPVVDFSHDDNQRAIMQLRYRMFTIAECNMDIRSYYGPWAIEDFKNIGDIRPIGPTMLINPGDVYNATIVNLLPSNATDLPDKTEDLRMFSQNNNGEKPAHEIFGGHGGKSTRSGYVPPETTMPEPNIPHDFNVTNLHTHGWHVSPADNSDNVLIAIPPKSEQDKFNLDHIYHQTIYLPSDHIAGTFWYHPHKHGSTTIQVGSGMAGALKVVDGSKGLGAIPAIAKAEDHLFVFQQVGYDSNGLIEDYSNLQEGPFDALNRPTLVNGQVYPKLQVKVNEVQRWRFVHAGITTGISPAIVKADSDCSTVTDFSAKTETQPESTIQTGVDPLLWTVYRFSGHEMFQQPFCIKSYTQGESTLLSAVISNSR